jgi:hypothetical protein
MNSGYPSGLTVSAFEMLLHYFYTPVDAAGAADPTQQNYRACKELEDAGLAEVPAIRSGEILGMWELTERGMALARHIVNLPLPECRWEMPHPQHTGESS